VVLLEDFRFIKQLNQQLSYEDKLELARLFKVKKVSAGQRIFTHDKIDGIYLIIKGKTGILNPETKLLNYIKNGNLNNSTVVMS